MDRFEAFLLNFTAFKFLMAYVNLWNDLYKFDI